MEHRVVDVTAKRAFHGLDVGLVPIGRELHAIYQPFGQVAYELLARSGVTATDPPRRHELGVRADRNPRPHIADTGVRHLLQRNVLGLGVDERPYFVALQPRTGQITHDAVLIAFTRRPYVAQELDDRVLGRARHPTGGADRASLDQGRDDLDSLGCAELIYTD